MACGTFLTFSKGLTFSKRPTLKGGACAAGALAFLLSGAAMAHGGAEHAASKITRDMLATEPLPQDNTMTALKLTVAPGGSAPPHRHAGTLFVYVLSGAVRSQLNDGEAVLYGAGDSWTEPEGTLHSAFENPSDSETAELLVVFAAPTGAQLTTPEE